MKKVFIIYGILIVAVILLALFKFRNLLPFDSKQEVSINNHKFSVEVVQSDKDKTIGLTKYNSLAQNQGMLFVFDHKGLYAFWMKNMKFPIDMIFISDGKVVSIVSDAQPADKNATNPPMYTPSQPVNDVLEINAGLSKKYNINKGDTVILPK